MPRAPIGPRAMTPTERSRRRREREREMRAEIERLRAENALLRAARPVAGWSISGEGEVTPLDHWPKPDIG